MSWQARMMGIADIFEALTTKDCPYKEGMKLSQALKILENFRNNGHIDPDLHEVFVKSGVSGSMRRGSWGISADRLLSGQYPIVVDEYGWVPVTIFVTFMGWLLVSFSFESIVELQFIDNKRE